MSVINWGRTDGAVSEMEIVDTFTKLIFGGETHYTDQESEIIHGLRNSDPQLAFEDHAELGSYLSALGVEEMVKLVSQIRIELTLGHKLALTLNEPGVGSPRPPAI